MNDTVREAEAFLAENWNSSNDLAAWRELVVDSQWAALRWPTEWIGRRPTWTAAAKPEYAEPLVDKVVAELQQLGAHIETGRFRTYMQVSSVNDGPTTVSIEI